MKKNRRLAHCVLCLLMFVSVNVQGQVVYKAKSFEEMVSPYVLATQEYNRLETDINNLKGQVTNILAQKLDAEMRKK